jgi:hypothetical protein
MRYATVQRRNTADDKHLGSIREVECELCESRISNFEASLKNCLQVGVVHRIENLIKVQVNESDELNHCARDVRPFP